MIFGAVELGMTALAVDDGDFSVQIEDIIADAARSIRACHLDEFPLLRPTIPTRWENGPEFEPAATDWYLFVRIIPTTSRMLGIAGTRRCFRDHGEVQAQIYSPRGIGIGTMEQVADDIADLWREHRCGEVLFRAPRFNIIGPAGPHYQGNVTTPYQINWEVAS